MLFQNIGGYHAARLRALQKACQDKRWQLTAVQVTDTSREHQWGELKAQMAFRVRTLLPGEDHRLDIDRGEGASAAARAMDSFLESVRPVAMAIPGWGTAVARRALSWCKRHGALAILLSESKRDDEERHWWKEQVKSRLYVRRFDAALVGGRLHRDYLVDLGFPPERIFFGYDVVDNEYFREQAAKARQDRVAARGRDPRIPERPFFLVVTRLIERKNVARLVEAFADYRRQFEDDGAWDLAICGNGEEEERIRNCIDQLQIQSKVHLPGFVSYRKIGNWYGLANGFIHPATQEQWGLVVNEACAAGLPILCSHTTGARYDLVKENENGWLFDPRTKGEITAALLKLHKLDQHARLHMGKRSQDIVADFDPERFATGLFSAIEAAQHAKGS